MASDEIDMDMVLGAGGVVDSYTNSDAAVGELLPNINSDDDPALLGLDIDMSATATEVRAYCESIRIRWIINLIACSIPLMVSFAPFPTSMLLFQIIPDWDTMAMEYFTSEGEEPIGNSHDGIVRADGRTQSTTGGVLGHLNGDINYAESAVELSEMKSWDRDDDRSGVDGVEPAANTPSEDADVEDPLDGKGECDPIGDDSLIQHIGGNEKRSSNVGKFIDSAQCVSGVNDSVDSADGLISSTGGGGGIQGLMIQGTHGFTAEIHGEANCGGKSLLSV